MEHSKHNPHLPVLGQVLQMQRLLEPKSENTGHWVNEKIIEGLVGEYIVVVVVVVLGVLNVLLDIAVNISVVVEVVVVGIVKGHKLPDLYLSVEWLKIKM